MVPEMLIRVEWRRAPGVPPTRSMPGTHAPQPEKHELKTRDEERLMGKAVGIDLGTTNSVVAVMEGGRPHPPAPGKRRAPRDVQQERKGQAAPMM